MYKNPLLPALDDPVLRDKEPLVPLLEVPVLMTTIPLVPDKPPFEVNNATSPLLEGLL